MKYPKRKIAEPSEKLINTMTGLIYEGLIFSGVSEESISFFIRVEDKIVEDFRFKFLQELKEPIKNMFKLRNEYPKEFWDNLPKELPEWRELSKRRMKVKKLWQLKPPW